MKALERRLSELEQRRGVHGPTLWHNVLVDDQDEAQAIADYEAEHGPIGEDDGIIFVVFVAPTMGSA